MSTALQQTLSYIHNQKRQRGVDGALLRLYEPILWRSLAVANANVRRNAATILVEAFPLQDPSMPLTEVRLVHAPGHWVPVALLNLLSLRCCMH